MCSHGSLQIVSLDEIIKDYGKMGFIPFIVKIDIEGYEQELFSSNIDWIDNIPVIIIELHDGCFHHRINLKTFLMQSQILIEIFCIWVRIYFQLRYKSEPIWNSFFNK